jgi:hypothetical protein
MFDRSSRQRRGFVARRCLGVTALAAVPLGCYAIPESVKLCAADLPARADGQYAMIDDDSVKKSLVTKDAMLQCRIDEDKKSGETSPACQCAKSSSPDWTVDCKAWLGEHTPKRSEPAPAASPTTASTPAPMSS